MMDNHRRNSTKWRNYKRLIRLKRNYSNRTTKQSDIAQWTFEVQQNTSTGHKLGLKCKSKFLVEKGVPFRF